jgi:hypothetical protein
MIAQLALPGRKQNQSCNCVAEEVFGGKEKAKLF